MSLEEEGTSWMQYDVDDPDDEVDDDRDEPTIAPDRSDGPTPTASGHPEGELERTFEAVRRKTVVEIGRDTEAKSIEFQLWTIDYVCAHLKHNMPWPTWTVGCHKSDVVPVVRIFGLTRDGLSVRAQIFGYEPHFFCDPPPGVEDPSEAEWLRSTRVILNDKASVAIRHEKQNLGKGYDRPLPRWKRRDDGDSGWPIVTRVEAIKRRPIRGYRRSTSWILRICTRIPRNVPTVRRILEATGSLSETTPALKTYEADIPFDLRFMIDKGLTGCDWVAIDRIDSHADDTAFGCRLRYHAKSDALRIGGEDSWGNTRMRDAEIRHTEAMIDSMSGMKASTSKRQRDEDVGDDSLPKLRPTDDDASRCSIEIDAWHGDVRSVGINGEWAIHAPLRIMSFDVECATEAKRFVSAEDGDPAITICSRLTTGDEARDIGVALQLRSCDRVPDARIRTIWFDDERSLIMAWRDLVVQYDPDVITGFNILNFDFPYLLKRAELLGVSRRFSDFSRVRGDVVRCVKSNFSSKAVGTLDNNEVKIAGRLVHDVRQDAQRSLKLPSYTLNAVAAYAVGLQKIDMDHHELPKLFFHGTSADRCKIATYCDNDAALPLAIIRKRLLIVNAVEMSRATRVPISYLFTRGQQIRVMAQVLSKALECGYVVDSSVPRGEKRGAGDLGKKYEGAVVLEPERGFHDETVATLDFASLYPSIILSQNMCFTTILTDEQAELLHPDNRWKSPIGVWFASAPKMIDAKSIATANLDKGSYYENPNGTVSMRGGKEITVEAAKLLKLKEGADYVLAETGSAVLDSQKEHGLLPLVLMDLLSKRKQAKILLAKEKDPTKKAVYDGRQLALKICANSVYGSTGAENGKLPEQRIAASVTARGRELIETTRDRVHEKFRKENGYPDSRVIYGDTDSVMVKFRPEVPTGAKAAAIACATLTSRMALKAGGDDAMKAERLTAEHVSKSYPLGWKSIASRDPKPTQTEIFTEAHGCAVACVETICSGFVAIPQDIVREISEAAKMAIDMAVVEKAAEYGKEACVYINSVLPRPLSIEFEKVWLRFILSSKKRYAGVKCLEDPDTKKMVRQPDVATSGLETVRRDTCQLVRMEVGRVLGDVLIRHDPKLAVKNTRDMLAELRSGKMAMDKFVITKSLSKKKTPFATKQSHTALADRMRQRGDSRYALGDRVRMVMVDRGKKAKAYEKSEDPMRAEEEDIPLDREYYIENQLKKPLMRLFESIVPAHPEYVLDPDVAIDDALAGKRTKRMAKDERAKIQIVKSAPSKESTSIGRFLTISGMPCVGCGATVSVTHVSGIAPATCDHCKDMLPALCVLASKRLADAEHVLCSIRSHCSRCAKRLIGAMECASEECPLRFAKLKAYKNLRMETREMNRFSEELF